jgi:putative nucleotidyltransferase with HDIG domain
MMLRILFVDDEVGVLEAMRRTTRPMRNEWSMEFVRSGAAALDSLAKTPADVIVSDMRMPGMDGWQLLAEVKTLYPQTVRLVLSGHADAGAIMRLIGTAHQYIAKPGETETLKAAIAQTQLLKQLLTSDRLARLVGEVGTLPSCPKAFQDISHCLRKPDASVAEASRIIGRDVAMTANILKLVNSAFFGARQSITRVDRAVAYLGLDTVAALAMGHSLFQSSGSSAPGGVNLEGLWRHSLQTAMAARAIALVEKFPTARVEEAFLAGVLHDVGRVVYATQRTPKTGEPAGSIEDTADEINLHHAEVGAYLLGLWGFPSHIVAAVALHHTPSRRADTSFDLTALIHVADRLAHAQAESSPGLLELGTESGMLEGLGLLNHLPQWCAAIRALDSKQKAS